MTAFAAVALLLSLSPFPTRAQRQMEALGRGVVAVRQPARQYLSIPLRTPQGYAPGDASAGDLDGERPSPVMARGYYTRTVLTLGDWREEVVRRTVDNRELRVYTTTVPTGHRFYTFMHDPQYRLSVAWQNVGYNQPPHTGFFVGRGMKRPPRPNIVEVRAGK